MKKIIRITLFLMALLLLVGCGWDINGPYCGHPNPPSVNGRHFSVDMLAVLGGWCLLWVLKRTLLPRLQKVSAK